MTLGEQLQGALNKAAEEKEEKVKFSWVTEIDRLKYKHFTLHRRDEIRKKFIEMLDDNPFLLKELEEYYSHFYESLHHCYD